MPKREDERHRNIVGGHTPYCTCQNCVDQFLKKKKIKSRRRPQWIKETVKRHLFDCDCATCQLLNSVGGSPPQRPSEGRKEGFLSHWFGLGRK